MDWFSGDRVVEVQIVGVQKIAAIAGQTGKILKRPAGYAV